MDARGKRIRGVWVARDRAAVPAAIGGAVVVAGLLGGCATTVGASSAAAPAASAVASESATPAPASSAPASPAPADPAALTTHTFTSTSGHDATGDLAWITAEPLRLSFWEGNGDLNLGLKTPCNMLGVPSTVTGNYIEVEADHVTTAAMGCLGPEGGYEKWSVAFIQKPMAWHLNGDGTLTLTTDDAEVVFAQTS